MKKKIIAFAVLVLCTCVFVSSTLAFFTDEGTATNVFTTSGIEVVLEEWADEIGGNPYDATEPVDIMPGSKITKIITVLNKEEAAYVRAKYVVTLTMEDGTVLKSDSGDDVQFRELNKLIKFNGIDANWKLESDGWWYYQQKLDIGLTNTVRTAPLFTEVEFAGPEMGNEYQNCGISIALDAQAIQAKNIPVPDGLKVPAPDFWAANY